MADQGCISYLQYQFNHAPTDKIINGDAAERLFDDVKNFASQELSLKKKNQVIGASRTDGIQENNYDNLVENIMGDVAGTSSQIEKPEPTEQAESTGQTNGVYNIDKNVYESKDFPDR